MAVLLPATLLFLPLLSPADEQATLEVIEVTAQKRIQPIQSIPIAITAISPEQLTELQIVDASSIDQLVPNLNTTRSISGVYNYFIRGVGMDDFNLSSIPAVGLYVDDVAIQNPTLANFSLLDIARVEVLRGPQNTLYGKNTTGGAVNFISKAPTAGQEAENLVSLYGGSDSLMRLAAATHFSPNDSSAMSLALLHERQDGRVSSTHPGNASQFHNKDKQGFKLRFASNLTADVDFTASLYGGRQRQIAEIKSLLIGDEDTGLIDIDKFSLDEVGTALINPPNNADSLGGYLKFRWHNSGYSFTSISAFEDVETERMDDWGSQGYPSDVSQVATYNSSNTRSYSQELQVLSPDSQTFSWLGGVLLNKETGDILQTAFIDPGGPGRPDDDIDDAGIGPLFDRGAWVEVDTLTYSVYGQLDTEVSENTQMTAGMRWSTQRLTPNVHAAGMLMDDVDMPFPLGTFGWYSLGNNGFDILRDFAGFSVINNFREANNGFPATAKINETYREWGGKLALTHQWQKDAMVYASIARGFKMGSVNSNPTTAAFQSLLDNTVTPETLLTYEVGIKSEWLERRIRLNASLFWNRWQDYQFFLVYNPGNPASLFASVVNLPEAETKGLEVESTSILTDYLTLNLGIGYIAAEVTDGEIDTSQIQEDFREGMQNSVLTGDQLPNTPEWVISASLRGDYPLSHGQLQWLLHYEFKDAHIHALAGNNSDVWQHNFSENAVNLFSASARYTPKSYKDLSFHLWARNLSNEKYCTERATIPGTSADTVKQCAQGAFRELGLGMQLLF
ncbi:MAG: TonB-dependent receptor [Aestuariibacter sp.]